MPPALHVSTSWPALAAGEAGDRLAREALGPYLRAQRWFPAKTHALARVAIEESLPLGPRATLLIVAVDYEHGERHRFAMPLALATGEDAARVAHGAPARIVAELTGQVTGLLHDDMAEDLGTCLLGLVAGRAATTGAHGTLAGEPTEAFAALRGDAAALPARRVTAEQSNTSVIFGDRLILKLIRRLEPGLNPDYEVGRHLTDVARFPGVPALAGALLWRTEGADPVVLAIAQAFVPGAAVLRERLVADVASLMSRLASRAGATFADDALRADAATVIEQARALGRHTGALHLALADARGDAAFTPEAVGAHDLRTIAGEMRARTDEALDVLASRVEALPAPAQALARPVLARRRALLATVDRVAGIAPGLTRIRVHGDYQLDQVLLSGDAFVVIDFEGEPLRPLAERRVKFLALKDVAGMLRSYSYAAYAGLFAAAGDDEALAERLDPLARWWQAATGAAFLDGYREEVGPAAFVPAGDADFRTVLDAFIVEKATYELRYELGHRPTWVRIPLRGVAEILDRTSGR